MHLGEDIGAVSIYGHGPAALRLLVRAARAPQMERGQIRSYPCVRLVGVFGAARAARVRFACSGRSRAPDKGSVLADPRPVFRCRVCARPVFAAAQAR